MKPELPLLWLYSRLRARIAACCPCARRSETSEPVEPWCREIDLESPDTVSSYSTDAAPSSNSAPSPLGSSWTYLEETFGASHQRRVAFPSLGTE